MRLDIDTYKEILDTLTRNKSRSLLTGFGVFWGLFMLLFMLGGGNGFKAMMMKNFEGFATNTAILVADRTTKPFKGFKDGRGWSLETSDVERLRQMVPQLDVVSPSLSVWSSSAVREEYSYADAVVKGIGAEYRVVEEPVLKYGRYLNEMDILQERKVCVIGKRVYTELFPEGGNPCGQYIKAGPVYYQVIGVDYSASNISVNGNSQDAVLIPFPVAQKIYHRGNRVDLICVTGKPGVKLSTLETRVREVIAENHFFDPTDKPALFIIDTEQLFSMVDTLFTGINLLIWLVGLGTILAGAIGVSNIMLVTVKERTIEIGIRRAIGATPRDILSQIMMESVALTSAAGVLGIMFTVGCLAILEKSFPGTPFQIGFWPAVLALVLVALLGVVTGLAPASRAMAIKPVDAMRDE